MSRALQDQFIDDDEEETCPLCVEEFDLQDKGFRPCTCGYQICQFCYHNVKTNMNGLCPACRRPYDDNDIEWKVITPEETAAHKARQAQKQKKTQAALQKEKQKAEADNLSRKHLAGLRVVQKNLVYVTGLSPTTQEDQLLQTLRGDQYFGQYGKIIKIVVSKAKDPAHPHSVGVYVTYEQKEDAALCISVVNGSKNVERTLRAQFGTTKYCSAYLRGENCTNRNCMFLHEPGEANESYSRADLSALNAGVSQHDPGRAPPPQSQQPVASASQPMAWQASSDQAQSPTSDRPALPSTASWASKPAQLSQTESRSTSGTVESPAPTSATPAPTIPEQSPQDQSPVSLQDKQPEPTPQATPQRSRPRKRREPPTWLDYMTNIPVEDFKLRFSITAIPEEYREIVKNYPPLFDVNGGAKRRLRRQREEEQRRLLEQEAQAFQPPPAVEPDDNPEMSGSLQLGGEPEERQSLSRTQSAIQPPRQPDGFLDQRFRFGDFGDASSLGGISERGMTPQQHQQLLLQTMKTPNPQGSSYLNNLTSPSSFQQQQSNPPGHQRNASRYSFANDSSASTAVKPVANAKLLNQQSSIMPQQIGANHFGGNAQQQQHQSHGSQFYTSNVQGPPPGLKTTGTPPVSGGMTFGQGHGFATGGLQYGAAANAASGRNANEEMMRNLLRGGSGSGSVSTADNNNNNNAASAAAKHDADFPPLAAVAPTPSHSHHQSMTLGVTADDDSSRATPPVPPGFEAPSQSGSESRRSETPTVPPGLGLSGKLSSAAPSDLLEAGGSSSSRPSSRAGLKRTVSAQIQPALPLRPATPRVERKRVEEGQVGEVEMPSRGTRIGEVGTSADQKTIASRTPRVKDVPDETTLKAVPAGLSADERVGLENGKTVPVLEPAQKSARTGMEPVSKREAPVQSSDAKPAPVTPSKSDFAKIEPQKRKHPGKLDITAAVSKKEPEISSSATPASGDNTLGKAQHDFSQVLSATSKPESPCLSSPAAKSAPRTLRVVSTPKADTPPSVLPFNPTVAPKDPTLVAAVAKLPSRQPSVASINIPGTPSSEQISISDNISLTSTSQSRASSPPPAPPAGIGSKVGSAPMRAKTKSQMKKERQERAKVMEEEKPKTDEPAKPGPVSAATAAVANEPAQEAIVSRKKKAKKEKETRAKTKAPAPTATGDSTPTASRPASPGAKSVPDVPAKIEQPVKEAKPTKLPTRTKAPVPSPTHRQPPTPPMQSPHEPSPPPTPTLTAAQLLAELKAQAPEIQKCIDTLFRSPASNQFKPNQNILPKDLGANPQSWKSDYSPEIRKEDVEALLKGNIPAFRYGGDEGRVWDRGMVTPSGAHLRALNEELEARVLDLERAIRDIPEELRFRPTKPQNDMKFPSLDLEALKRQFENVGSRGPSVMEQMVQDGSRMKKGAFLLDEASKYINEFVMPPATPPPSAGGGTGGGSLGVAAATGAGMQSAAVGTGAGAGVGEPVVLSVDIAERQLSEARRVADERDGALKKIVKKNRKLLGLG